MGRGPDEAAPSAAQSGTSAAAKLDPDFASLHPGYRYRSFTRRFIGNMFDI